MTTKTYCDSCTNSDACQNLSLCANPAPPKAQPAQSIQPDIADTVADSLLDGALGRGMRDQDAARTLIRLAFKRGLRAGMEMTAPTEDSLATVIHWPSLRAHATAMDRIMAAERAHA